jgi:2-oxoglutarate ferredoxin oxidoreductase subunit beta
MTGGQVSPTTPHGFRATTAARGNPEGSFDIASLVACAGASFVARESVSKPRKMSRLIERAIAKNGFALVEVFTPCPTAFGRRNKIGKPLDNLSWISEKTVEKKKADKLSDQEREGRLITGVLTDVDREEYTEMYDRLIQELRAEGMQPALPESEVVTAWSLGKEEEKR